MTVPSTEKDVMEMRSPCCERWISVRRDFMTSLPLIRGITSLLDEMSAIPVVDLSRSGLPRDALISSLERKKGEEEAAVERRDETRRGRI